LLLLADLEIGVLRMRRPDPIAATARSPWPSPGWQDRAAVQLVCLALALSVLALGCRIASVW
jgi:hypothetical protein